MFYSYRGTQYTASPFRKLLDQLDVVQLNLYLFEYIEGFYNLKRPHYSLDLMTPNERELAFHEH